MSNNTLRTGEELHSLMTRLFPINRSLTGDGVRETLSILQEYLPSLKIHETISGSKAFDWKVPPEWNVRKASLIDSRGNIIFDTERGDTNLHVVGYSEKVDIIGLDLEELRPHIKVGQSDLPDSVPYVTAYYVPRGKVEK